MPLYLSDPKLEDSWATCPRGVSIWVNSWPCYSKFTPFTWAGSVAHIPLGSNYTFTCFLSFLVLYHLICFNKFQQPLYRFFHHLNVFSWTTHCLIEFCNPLMVFSTYNSKNMLLLFYSHPNSSLTVITLNGNKTFKRGINTSHPNIPWETGNRYSLTFFHWWEYWGTRRRSSLASIRSLYCGLIKRAHLSYPHN